eukprot:3870306-Lingulodinium_polyedra.AAC.1
MHSDRAPERCLPFEGREPVCVQNPERVAERVAKGAQSLGSDLAWLGTHLTDSRGPVRLW